jgi:hypothetical protein
MPRGIFHIDADNKLSELIETPYDSEDLLQALLADHPSVLAGDSGESGGRRRWLLITREASVPDSLGGTGRWSVDHVFLDQDAVPTLVEVKRSSDTRIRREVVGQMLDYAANALVHWPPDQLREFHQLQCSARGIDAAEHLRATLGDNLIAGEFWERARTNLTAGRVRLVFVADEIPPELRRVVEFLNGQMNPAEVLAIEVRQYVGNGVRTLVPIVVGQTATAEQRKAIARPQGAMWDEPRFMAALEEQAGATAASVAREILRWAEQGSLRVTWGRGVQDGSFVPVIDHRGAHFPMFAVYTYGRVEIYFQYYREKPPFSDERLRRELLDRLNAIPEVRISLDSLERRPSIALSALSHSESLEAFLHTFQWFRERILQS